MCASTDMNLGTGCYRAANPRADRAVVSNEVLSLINTGNLYYNYDYNDPQWAWLLAQQRRAFQFSTSSWPLSETPTNLPRPPLAVDKAFRAWDGTSFVGGWPHEEANYMNGNFLLSVGYDQLVMDQAIYTAYPNFWAETYSVTNPDTIGAELENQCTNNGQNVTAVLNNHTYLRDYGRVRARSVSQLQLWMHRPRVVRNFDVCQGGGNKLNYTAPFLQADLDAVDAIWDDTTLQSFWKSSELVENAAYTTMFRTRGVRPFQSDWNAYPSRYWFLETDREKGTSSPPTGFIGFKSGATLDLNPITNMTDVVAIARVQTSPTKRYLVYAFTQTPATQKRVKITVPGAQFSNLYVDVDQGGSFFVVNDPASLSLASVTTLSPASVPVSTSDFTLTINGSNFYPGSVVKMGTTALTTTYVSPGQLKAVVTDADATVGSHNITVVNAGPGASPSSTLTVTP